MKNIKPYDLFLNESKLMEAEIAKTSPVALPKPDGNITVSVVKNVSGTGSNQKVLKGAFRIKGGPTGVIDYEVDVNIPLVYTGNVTPSKFWKSTKGDYYVLQTNVKGQQQKIPTDDMKELISGYKAGKSKIEISKIGTSLTFTRTWDFKNFK